MFHLDRLLPYSKNIRLGWKGLTGANTLAYYENSQFTDRKSFITLDPGDDVIKLFSTVADEEAKLECLSLTSFSGLVFASKTGACRNGATWKHAPDLAHKYQTRLKGLAGDNYSI